MYEYNGSLSWCSYLWWIKVFNSIIVSQLSYARLKFKLLAPDWLQFFLGKANDSLEFFYSLQTAYCINFYVMASQQWAKSKSQLKSVWSISGHGFAWFIQYPKCTRSYYSHCAIQYFDGKNSEKKICTLWRHKFCRNLLDESRFAFTFILACFSWLDNQGM